MIPLQSGRYSKVVVFKLAEDIHAHFIHKRRSIKPCGSEILLTDGCKQDAGSKEEFILKQIY